jgi:hypothetical protein
MIIIRLKLVKAIAGLKKSDSGEHLKHASVTPDNTEYTKYDPPGAQNSHGELTTKIPFLHSFPLVKL